MTDFVDRNMNQTAVYWTLVSVDGFGKQTFAAPVELSVRWEQKQELFIDAEGNEKISQAVVATAVDVTLEGYLFLGELVDLDSSQDPLTQSGAYQIKGFSKIPSVKGTSFRRRAWLRAGVM